jgi:hypothetical protein
MKIQETHKTERVQDKQKQKEIERGPFRFR